MDKKILAGLLALICSISLYAGVVSTNVAPAATEVSLLSTGGRTSQFIIANTNLTVNGLWTFFDAPTNGLTWTNVFTNTYTMSLPTTFTNLYTNYFGVTTTVIYTNSTEVTATNALAAATNGYPVLFSLIVPTNSSAIVNFSQRFANGLACTNSGGGSVSVTYTQ